MSYPHQITGQPVRFIIGPTCDLTALDDDEVVVDNVHRGGWDVYKKAQSTMSKKPKSKPLGPVERTNRGFESIEFLDRYQKKCSLQQSSLADYEQPGTSAVWLGVDDPEPKILAKDAHQLGVPTDQTVGWVPYPIPGEVLLYTRMHLDREQVAALIAALQCWLDNGSFEHKGVGE